MRFTYFASFVLFALPVIAAPLASLSPRLATAAMVDDVGILVTKLVSGLDGYSTSSIKKIFAEGSEMSLEAAKATMMRQRGSLLGDQVAIGKVYQAAIKGDRASIDMIQSSLNKYNSAFSGTAHANPGRQAAPIGSALWASFPGESFAQTYATGSQNFVSKVSDKASFALKYFKSALGV